MTAAWTEGPDCRRKLISLQGFIPSTEPRCLGGVGGAGGAFPDLWKHAEVGTTGSNQEKIRRPATGARLLVNVCNVCQRSSSACLLCSPDTLMWPRSIPSDPFSSPDNQDDRQRRALLHFLLISRTESSPAPLPLPHSTLPGVM